MAFNFANTEKKSNSTRWFLTVILVAALFAAPFILPDYRFNLLARFLTYAIVALGLDLLWGYTGILSLGHGVYFGLGAYCMAMHLTLVATGGKMPMFMATNDLETIPWWWSPFSSPVFAIGAALFIPTILGYVIGYAAFRNRIKGVFFSILSQALALVIVELFKGQQGYIGGTNGLTDFKTFLGFDLDSVQVSRGIYWITALCVIGAFLLCRLLVNGKAGKILVALRDGENRTRFIGYNPVTYQTFVYSLSAGLAGLAGMLFVLQEGFIEPQSMNILISINMILWVAVGGRGTLVGAVLGALLINFSQTFLQEKFPQGEWLYFVGFLFIGVVLFLPNGIVGWWLTFSKSPRFGFVKNAVGRVAQNGKSNAVKNAA